MQRLGKSIFLIAGEDKDIYCLEPLISELKRQFRWVHMIPYRRPVTADTSLAIHTFCSEDRPLALLCSTGVREFLDILRPAGSYDTIGIEHGFAPFKSYTYGEHLVSSDYYIAPTGLWADRLKRIHPGKADRVALGGYPRIESLKDLRAEAKGDGCCPSKEMAHWIHSGVRKLVILSWGTDAAALDLLPDLPNVAYLYHPGDKAGLEARQSKNCSLFLSSPETTSLLLAHADEVYGDFSSLTLEAVAMGIPTRMFIDRSLYISDCDMAPEFFDRASAGFGAIPETGERIHPSLALDVTDLAKRLAGGETETPRLTEGLLPSGILPPSGQDNRVMTADVVQRIAADLPSEKNGEAHLDRKQIDALLFLMSAYQNVLGRPADAAGLTHHMQLIEDRAHPNPIAAFSILKDFAHSEEGRQRFEQGYWRWPEFTVAQV